jgi:hypothetical protein
LVPETNALSTELAALEGVGTQELPWRKAERLITDGEGFVNQLAFINRPATRAWNRRKRHVGEATIPLGSLILAAAQINPFEEGMPVRLSSRLVA